jgi:hypothetical protein
MNTRDKKPALDELVPSAEADRIQALSKSMDMLVKMKHNGMAYCHNKGRHSVYLMTSETAEIQRCKWTCQQDLFEDAPWKEVDFSTAPMWLAGSQQNGDFGWIEPRPVPDRAKLEVEVSRNYISPVWTYEQLNRQLFHQEHVDVAVLLINCGADPSYKNSDGYTCLHGCANANVTSLLIHHGADVNAKAADGSTPLHHLPSPEIMELLLQNGADVLAADKEGDIPLDWAKRYLFNEPGHENYVAVDPELAKAIYEKLSSATSKTLIERELSPFATDQPSAHPSQGNQHEAPQRRTRRM